MSSCGRGRGLVDRPRDGEPLRFVREAIEAREKRGAASEQAASDAALCAHYFGDADSDHKFFGTAQWVDLSYGTLGVWCCLNLDQGKATQASRNVRASLRPQDMKESSAP